MSRSQRGRQEGGGRAQPRRHWLGHELQRRRRRRLNWRGWSGKQDAPLPAVSSYSSSVSPSSDGEVVDCSGRSSGPGYGVDFEVVVDKGHHICEGGADGHAVGQRTSSRPSGARPPSHGAAAQLLHRRLLPVPSSAPPAEPRSAPDGRTQLLPRLPWLGGRAQEAVRRCCRLVAHRPLPVSRAPPLAGCPAWGGEGERKRGRGRRGWHMGPTWVPC